MQVERLKELVSFLTHYWPLVVNCNMREMSCWVNTDAEIEALKQYGGADYTLCYI